MKIHRHPPKIFSQLQFPATNRHPPKSFNQLQRHRPLLLPNNRRLSPQRLLLSSNPLQI